MVVTETGLGLVWDTSEANAPFLHFLMTDFFSSRLNDARNNSATILSIIPSSNQYVSGKFVIEPVKFGRNPNAFNFVREGGQFPDPGHTKSRTYSYRSRTQFHRFVLQGKILRASKGESTRYVDPIVDLMADHMDDYVVDMSRMMYSDGSGRLCEFVSGPAAETGTVTLRINQDVGTAYGSGAAVAGASDEPPTHYLETGMRLAIIQSTGAAIRGFITIDSIDSDSTVTASTTGISVGTNIASFPSIALGDWLVKCSNDDSLANVTSTAFRQEPVGLGGIFAYGGIFDGNGPSIEAGSASAAAETSLAYTYSGTDLYTITNQYWFQGLPAHSSAAGWTGDLEFNRGVVSHNSGTKRTPTESLIQRFYSQVKRTNNAAIDVIVSRDEVRDTYAETLLPDKRYNDTLQLKGGWDPALVGPAGVPWVTDIRCQHNRAYCMALDDGGFMQHIEEPLGWATEQGANVWQYLQDDDIYQARMVEAFAVGVGVRNRCGGLIVDLSES